MQGSVKVGKAIPLNEEFVVKDYLKKVLEEYPRKTIDTRELASRVQAIMGEGGWEKAGGYEVFAGDVESLVAEGVLSPVKTSGSNGRVPPLAVRYRLEKEKSAVPAELFNFRSGMDLSYFYRYPTEYECYRKVLQGLDDFLLKTENNKPGIWDTVNERSLQLAGDEKFLSSGEGSRLLSRVKLTLADLYCYKVSEPFFYRQFRNKSITKDTVHGLIVENKDTFATVLRLLEYRYLRFSPSLDLLIYGEGNKITRSWSFIDSIPGVEDKKVRLFYFGDLDPEGINIFNRLRAAVGGSAREIDGADDNRADDNRADDNRADDDRAEDNRAEDDRAEEAEEIEGSDEAEGTERSESAAGVEKNEGEVGEEMLPEGAKAGIAPVPRIELAQHLYFLLLRQGICRPLRKEIDAGDIENLQLACRDSMLGLAGEIRALWEAGWIIPQEALAASRLKEIGEINL